MKEKEVYKITNYSDQELQIIYQNTNYLVVYKPANINVHHDHHHQENTVADFVLPHLNFPPATTNPGIVHRLDKLTSGLLVVPCHPASYQYFYQLFKTKKMVRKYFALVKGKVTEEKFKVIIPLLKSSKKRKVLPSLGGQKSITNFTVKKSWSDQTLLSCQLETGKTHQIRVQLQYIKHPIINDPLYYQGKDKYLYLHAYHLEFYDVWRQRTFQFRINIPQHFQIKTKLKCII